MNTTYSASPIAEERIPVMLDRERAMIFNANTMMAFEKQTGKHYWKTIADLYELVKPQYEQMKQLRSNPETKPDDIMSLVMSGFLANVPVTDVTVLIWAAIHEYDGDNPVWPMTLPQVARYLNSPAAIIAAINGFIHGMSLNTPTTKEMGEYPARPHATVETRVASAGMNGGDSSIALPEDAFS